MCNKKKTSKPSFSFLNLFSVLSAIFLIHVKPFLQMVNTQNNCEICLYLKDHFVDTTTGLDCLKHAPGVTLVSSKCGGEKLLTGVFSHFYSLSIPSRICPVTFLSPPIEGTSSWICTRLEMTAIITPTQFISEQ